MSYGQHVRQLVARGFNGPILNFSGNLRRELSCILLSEVRVVASVTLNANFPALLRHSKNESPAVLRIEISISKHKEALVVSELNIFLKIVKNMSCVILLDTSV